MKKTLRRSVLAFAFVFALSFGAGLLVRYARDAYIRDKNLDWSASDDYLRDENLDREDVLRTLRQEGIDLFPIENKGFTYYFDAIQERTYQCDETNSMTLYLYSYQSAEDREAVSAPLVQEKGLRISDPIFVVKNIMFYTAFHARRSELLAKLEHAVALMGGERIQ